MADAETHTSMIKLSRSLNEAQSLLRDMDDDEIPPNASTFHEIVDESFA